MSEKTPEQLKEALWGCESVIDDVVKWLDPEAEYFIRESVVHSQKHRLSVNQRDIYALHRFARERQLFAQTLLKHNETLKKMRCKRYFELTEEYVTFVKMYYDTTEQLTKIEDQTSSRFQQLKADMSNLDMAKKSALEEIMILNIP